HVPRQGEEGLGKVVVGFLSKADAQAAERGLRGFVVGGTSLETRIFRGNFRFPGAVRSMGPAGGGGCGGKNSSPRGAGAGPGGDRIEMEGWGDNLKSRVGEKEGLGLESWSGSRSGLDLGGLRGGGGDHL
ncbi:unnamed protein product, partial [Discosporangium mesarthrocarpum]